MSLSYIRDYYQVPAHRFGRIVYTGERGRAPRFATIVAAKGTRLRVRFDDTPDQIDTLHPIWEVDYLTEAADTAGQLAEGMPPKDPRKFADALAGREPADALSCRDRRLLVSHLHDCGFDDRAVAALTRMTLYTAARIREELGLAPLPDREKAEVLTCPTSKCA